MHIPTVPDPDPEIGPSGIGIGNGIDSSRIASRTFAALLALLILLSSPAFPDEAVMTSGFHEAVVSVSDLEAYRKRLAGHGVTPINGPSAITMKPYGEVDIITIRAPEGAWLEFYQPKTRDSGAKEE